MLLIIIAWIGGFLAGNILLRISKRTKKPDGIVSIVPNKDGDILKVSFDSDHIREKKQIVLNVHVTNSRE